MCGIVAVYGTNNVVRDIYESLTVLQHRGQESAGIVSYDSKHFYVVKEEGLVSDAFNSENLAYLKGKDAIGHVRYSTTGGNNINNIQPLYSKTVQGKIAIAHNGNLTNAYTLYKKLEAEGALFQTTIDSETILHLVSINLHVY